jgi:transketolase
MNTPIKQVPTDIQRGEAFFNAIPFLHVDTIQKATSGYAGLPFEAGHITYVIWIKFSHVVFTKPERPNQNRFIFPASYDN